MESEKAEYDTDAKLSDNLYENEAMLKSIFANCSDFYARKITLHDSIPALLVYLRVMVDSNHLDKALIEPLIKHCEVNASGSSHFIEIVKQESVSVAQADIIAGLNETSQRIANGEVVLLLDCSKEAIAVKLENKKTSRALEEPNTEAIIRGPHIGFIEDIDTNMALIRKRIRTPRLKMEKLTIGKVSKTSVIIAYIDNIASPDVIHELKKRLSTLEIDIIMESGQIEELIRDTPYTPFPLMNMTERPDVVSAFLYEGKAAVLVEGTPMALVLPSTFWHGFQVVEDYYMSFIFATPIRWLRYLFAILALLLPSFYIAVSTFHQQMLPTGLALSVAASREVAPFPTLIETLMMEVTFEGLREAGIRLPRQVGQTISIVGALVIGEAAVQAGIISAPIIIIVSLTGIASFLIPKVNMNQAVRILRFPLMLLAGTFGLYGMGAGMIAILIHLVNLRSFGVPYMSPLAPFHASGLWDVLVRAPWRVLHNRQRQGS